MCLFWRAVQADLLSPASLRSALGHSQFDTVLDSAVFHCFVRPEQETYAANLAPYVRAAPDTHMALCL